MGDTLLGSRLYEGHVGPYPTTDNGWWETMGAKGALLHDDISPALLHDDTSPAVVGPDASEMMEMAERLLERSPAESDECRDLRAVMEMLQVRPRDASRGGAASQSATLHPHVAPAQPSPGSHRPSNPPSQPSDQQLPSRHPKQAPETRASEAASRKNFKDRSQSHADDADARNASREGKPDPGGLRSLVRDLLAGRSPFPGERPVGRGPTGACVPALASESVPVGPAKGPAKGPVKGPVSGPINEAVKASLKRPVQGSIGPVNGPATGPGQDPHSMASVTLTEAEEEIMRKQLSIVVAAICVAMRRERGSERTASPASVLGRC
eukprot:jgi/Mesvir1/27526/Mv07287-RA.1